MKIAKKVSAAFEDDIFNWDYETYLELGGYGSGKSYHIALKIILKLLKEKRKALVVRQVYDTMQESCYDLICEILDDIGLLTSSPYEYRKDRNKVLALKSPLRINFHNGSKIVFKGMDKPEKVKSINNVSIVWVEECSEVNFAAYEELQGRIRTWNVSMHFILSCNPVGKECWIYRHFFRYQDEYDKDIILMDEENLYEKKCIVSNGIYYHHTLPTDNPWLPWQYLKRLDDMQRYDPYLYMVARWGRFGATGTRVLPQLTVAAYHANIMEEVKRLGPANIYHGFDFGFEESYNAVIDMAVDSKRGYLYIFNELYINHVTDYDFANFTEMQKLKDEINALKQARQSYHPIIADNEDPKAISYYKKCGFPIRACRNKFHGSRLSNTRKIKRFRKIIVSPLCKNTIRELKDLTYKKDTHGNVVYDQFNIDPHTFSAIWYGLDEVTVADAKERTFSSRSGN